MFLPADIDTTNEAALESFYIHHFDVLAVIGISELNLPEDAAADIAHDVLMAALWQSPRITDVDTWLRSAMADGAHHYLRERK